MISHNTTLHHTTIHHIIHHTTAYLLHTIPNIVNHTIHQYTTPYNGSSYCTTDYHIIQHYIIHSTHYTTSYIVYHTMQHNITAWTPHHIIQHFVTTYNTNTISHPTTLDHSIQNDTSYYTTSHHSTPECRVFIFTFLDNVSNWLHVHCYSLVVGKPQLALQYRVVISI